MLHSQTEPGRRTVVEDIDGVAIKTDDFGEAIDGLRDPVEGVWEVVGLAATGHVGLAEATDTAGKPTPHPAVSNLGRVQDGRGGLGHVGMAPFPVPAHQTGRADFPHPAFRLGSPRGTRQAPR